MLPPLLLPCRLLRPGNPNSLLINSLLIISQLARSTHAHYDALAGERRGVALAGSRAAAIFNAWLRSS